eukprot:jgi/Ulvmu1/2092/UM124_0007.1
MDNLYVRLHRSDRTPLGFSLLFTFPASPAVYLSGITLQADAAISIVNTTFVDNTQVDDADSVLHLNSTSSTAWLRGVTFARNNAARVVVSDSGGAIYSDTPLQYYSTVDRSYVAASRTPGASASLFPSLQDTFLSFAMAQSGSPAVPRAPASMPAQTFYADIVTEVATAESLQQAIQNGDRHIMVTAHMDLTSLNPPFNPEGVLLGFFSDSSRSIRGNCSSPPELQLEGPSLLPLLAGQCVLIADMYLLRVRFGWLWMHNLYLRHAVSARDDNMALIELTSEGGRLWLTKVTLQGAGMYRAGTGARGLVASGPTYVDGCRISQLGGRESVVFISSAPMRVINTTFADNTGTADDAAVLHADLTGSSVWLQGSALVNNSNELPLVADSYSAGFASDVPRDFYDKQDFSFKEARQRPEDTSMFLSGDDDWLKGVQAGL